MDISSADRTGDPFIDAVDGVDRIADQVDILASANRWFDDELQLIYASRTPLSQTTVNRLVALGERMRPAAEARDRLARLDPALLLAGFRVWVGRQSPTCAESVAGRAQRVWSAGDFAVSEPVAAPGVLGRGDEGR